MVEMMYVKHICLKWLIDGNSLNAYKSLNLKQCLLMGAS